MSAAERVPAPPVPLKCNNCVLPRGTILHRIHDRQFGSLTFNPGLGNSRFAPFSVSGTSIPTAYFATSLDCAIFETLFHEIEPDAPFKFVRWSAIERLICSEITLETDVQLASLFSADLLKWGIARNQLIDTPKSTYRQTRAWSPALHGAPGAPAGMIWTSRKFDEEKALILFGDRIPVNALSTARSSAIVSDPALLGAVQQLAKRAGIDIIR